MKTFQDIFTAFQNAHVRIRSISTSSTASTASTVSTSECSSDEPKSTTVENRPETAACLFDIDGVFIFANDGIKNAPEAYRIVQQQNIPHVFLTNASGLAQKKAAKLNHVLKPERPITAEQIIMAQTPAELLFQKGGELADKHCLVISNTHDGLPHSVAGALGCKNYCTVPDVTRAFPRLDWMDRGNWKDDLPADDQNFPEIEAIVILGEPKGWETMLQVAMDVLISEGRPQIRPKNYPIPDTQLPVYAVNMDLAWKAKAEQPRFGNGAFLVCLEALYKKFTGKELIYKQLIGKPSAFSYEFALDRAQELYPDVKIDTVYGIGDNLKSDIDGINNFKKVLEKRGVCGKSVLVKTGVDKVVPTVKPQYDHAHRDFVDIPTAGPDYIFEDLYEFVVEKLEVREKASVDIEDIQLRHVPNSIHA